jgi:hypothetical protein
LANDRSSTAEIDIIEGYIKEHIMTHNMSMNDIFDDTYDNTYDNDNSGLSPYQSNTLPHNQFTIEHRHILAYLRDSRSNTNSEISKYVVENMLERFKSGYTLMILIKYLALNKGKWMGSYNFIDMDMLLKVKWYLDENIRSMW